MTDEDLKAIYVYLRSIPPIRMQFRIMFSTTAALKQNGARLRPLFSFLKACYCLRIGWLYADHR